MLTTAEGMSQEALQQHPAKRKAEEQLEGPDMHKQQQLPLWFDKLKDPAVLDLEGASTHVLYVV